MDTEKYYRIGQAVEILKGKTTNHHLRILCKKGLISGAIETAAGQWRIPAHAIERMDREGIPPVPAGGLGDSGAPAAPGMPMTASIPRSPDRSGLYADPSPILAEAQEDVLIAERRVKKRRHELEYEEVEDKFRERDARAAESEAQERQRQADVNRQYRQQQFIQECILKALRRKPSDAPAETILDITTEVIAALEMSNIEPLEESAHGRDWGVLQRHQEIVDRLIDAALAKALSAWQRQKEAARVAAEHTRRCEYIVSILWAHEVAPNCTYDELQEAKEAVREALTKLPMNVSERQMEKARDVALQPIRISIVGRQEREMRQSVLNNLNLPLEMAREDQAAALDAAENAIAQLPCGTTRGLVELACATATQPYKEAHEQKEQKNKLVEGSLRGMFSYLLKLDKDWDFGKGPLTLEIEIKAAIRQALEEELEGTESQDEADKVMKRLVKQELDI